MPQATILSPKWQISYEFSEIILLQLRQSKRHLSANTNRSPHPAYRVGDEVYLDTRNVSTSRPVKKLDHKFIGPFKVKEVLGSYSYKIDLPFEYELMHDTSFIRAFFALLLLQDY